MQIQKPKIEELLLEAKNFFSFYKKEIGKTVKLGKNIILTNFENLASFSPALSENLILFPEETLQLLELALEESGLVQNPRVRLLELTESHAVKIREIRAKHLNHLLQVEGIIRQSSEVRPQVVNAKFECPSCGTMISLLQIERKFREPSRCSCGRKSGFKLIAKDMVDAQRIVIEESPEALIGGEQPRRMQIFLKEDLVEPKMEEKTTPGSKVKIIGILKEIPVPLPTGSIQTRFDLAIEANNVIPMEESFEELEISEEDERQIKELAADPNIFQRLAESIAPSIYGYEEIKQSIVLQLFGGVQKVKSDGNKTRGDLHILLIGDPGVAKSQILKFISSIAPKGRYTVGKGASGAGLTATVVRDEFMRGWSLEAGAMVLSNKGVLCIDELEKMDPNERSAMHESLEQQCFLPDFQLTFPDGSHQKIGEFVDSLMEENKEKIQQGINCEILEINKGGILTTDFEKIYPAQINKVSKHVAPEKFVKITLANGREITVTPEHPCWIVSEGKITTVPAIQMRQGEFFPIPRELPIKGQTQNLLFQKSSLKNGPALSKIIGYHITDGCYELNRGIKNGIQFSNKDTLLIQDYKNAIKNFFDKEPSLTKQNEQYSVRVISKEIANFMKNLDENLMEKGIKKIIPEQIMKCRNDDIAFLIAALFDGDGTVTYQKRNGCRITLITENIKLAEQVTELLLRFGILSSIYRDREFFRVDISGQENILKFYNKITLLSEHKRKRIEQYVQKEKSYKTITDIVPHATEKIKEIFDKLHIFEKNNPDHQIDRGFERQRRFLKKLARIAEEKLKQVKQAKEIIQKTNSAKIIGEQREKLNLSLMSIANRLQVSDYLLEQREKRNTNDFKYQQIMLEKIEEMLSTETDLKMLKKLAYGSIAWSKIKSIEIIPNLGIKWVYDITVEPAHAFISNNMVLHNSVTISKANIHASLRAETSVLAAANPKLGRFDPYQPIAQQIDIPPTLLNRFDVIFTLRDLPDRAKDEAIATHVLTEHQQASTRNVIDRFLLRKYFSYARQKIKPQLTEEAVEEIKRFYVELRNSPSTGGNEIKPIPISARQLEALVRLSEASAKTRLSEKVTKDDAKIAINLVKYYMMQVGYDYETKTFDIDKIVTGVTTSQRSKIITVRELLAKLESRLGKLIPLEEIKKELHSKLTEKELEEALDKLALNGDIFYPRKGYVQRV